MTTTEQTGATALTARALGPDLARGFMLLFIALANSHYFLTAPSMLGGYPQDGSTIDSAATWLISTFVDARAFPLFGLLFGYGVAQIVRRHEPAGNRAVRHLLWRRSLFLVVVGFLHAMLLYIGDILAAYGVLLFLGVWAVRWKDRWLVIVATMFLLLNALPSDDAFSVSTAGPGAAELPTDILAMLGDRIVAQPVIALLGPIGFACPFLIGLWAGRRRVLEQPDQHRRLLVTTAVVGIGIGVLGALPLSTVLAGWRAVPPDETLSLLGTLHDSTGTVGGFGYAALIALVAARIGTRRGRFVDAISAVGQRSMTCYLAQSVVWTLVFTPFLLDLAGTLAVATTGLLATCTWGLTVVVADRMRRTGRRGPFEVAVRRFTYLHSYR